MLAYPNLLIIEATGLVSGVDVDPAGEQLITCECGELVSAAGHSTGDDSAGTGIGVTNFLYNHRAATVIVPCGPPHPWWAIGKNSEGVPHR